MLFHVLLAVDKAEIRTRLAHALPREDVVFEHMRPRSREAWSRMAHYGGDLLIISRAVIPEPALENIRLLRRLPEAPMVVVIHEHEDPVARAELLAAGCEAVLFAGLDLEHLRAVIAAILVKRNEELTGFASRSAAPTTLEDFIAKSPAMQAFMGVVRRVAPSQTTLLLLGETGVGKERLARSIHAGSPRANGPFVAVNCGALPETLLESELFGHEEGAFTGAVRSRRGSFETAHRGTIFLDEIGEMPAHLQVKLLRVLQEREIQRVGGEKPLSVDVRVMAATNRGMAAEVAAGRFRRDLYYRLGVVTLTVPPLRERREDTEELVFSYIRYFRHRIGRGVEGIAPAALQAFLDYAWPGNVRELINVVERAMILCGGHEITLADLPDELRGGAERPQAAALPVPAASGTLDLPPAWLTRPIHEVREEFLRAFEHAYLAGLLRASNGRIGETARRAGIRPRSLYEKMQKLGLRKEDYKAARQA